MSEHVARPPGTDDRVAGQAELRTATIRRIMQLCRSHGYREVHVPTFEHYEVFATLYGDEIRKRLLTFTTDREYALRPDLTAGICRMAVERLGGQAPVTPLRYASSGPAFRHERPRALRRREFTQVGIERIGDEASAFRGADQEILSMARLLLCSIGLRGGLVRVGHVEVRAQLLERVVEDVRSRARLGALLDLSARLRARLNPPRTGADLAVTETGEDSVRAMPEEHPDIEALMAELGRMGRGFVSTSTSTKDPRAMLGALESEVSSLGSDVGLEPAQIDALIDLTYDAASLGELADAGERLWGDIEEALQMSLGHVAECTEDLDPLVLRFSLAAVRGLGYYTGFTFEVDAPVLGPDVSQVIGGGRYDGVITALGGPELGAAGFAIGVERLVEAARLVLGERELVGRLVEPTPVLVCFGSGEDDAAAAARFGEQLQQKRAPLAFHPSPVADVTENGFSSDMLAALTSLPGRPYQLAVLVANGKWFVGYLDDGESYEMKRGEALTILTHRPL